MCAHSSTTRWIPLIFTQNVPKKYLNNLDEVNLYKTLLLINDNEWSRGILLSLLYLLQAIFYHRVVINGKFKFNLQMGVEGYSTTPTTFMTGGGGGGLRMHHCRNG